jgi:hypothetical protein
VEGRDQVELSRPGFGSLLGGALLAGALLGTLGSVVAGYLLRWIGTAAGRPEAAEAFRAFLSAGGWLWIPLWGAALAVLATLPRAPRASSRLVALAFAVALALLPLVFRPEVLALERVQNPRTPEAKSRAILKWSFRSPADVARIVPLSRDPDPAVRRQAVLALGVNRVVNDLEHPPAGGSRLATSPVRDSLRSRLLDALRHDPMVAVRAEAARALWNAPHAFGSVPAAAETLAALLDRSAAGGDERIAWLALDAAAGAPHPELGAAAARFAGSVTDPELARAARLAVSRWQTPVESGKKDGP